jgi:methionine aminopeptidase
MLRHVMSCHVVSRHVTSIHITLFNTGDIVNLDISTYYNGYHGDVNDTVLVGNVDETSRKLVQVTKEALDKAIQIGWFGLAYTAPRLCL